MLSLVRISRYSKLKELKWYFFPFKYVYFTTFYYLGPKYVQDPRLKPVLQRAQECTTKLDPKHCCNLVNSVLELPIHGYLYTTYHTTRIYKVSQDHVSSSNYRKSWRYICVYFKAEFSNNVGEIPYIRDIFACEEQKFEVSQRSAGLFQPLGPG